MSPLIECAFGHFWAPKKGRVKTVNGKLHVAVFNPDGRVVRVLPIPADMKRLELRAELRRINALLK